MNTTELNDIPFATCNSSWSAYVTMGLNIAIIAISLGKQFLNSKSQVTLTNAVKSLATPNVNLPTEQVQLNIPENLKASVQSNK